MPDGSLYQHQSLESVILTAMEQVRPFNILRAQVADWARREGVQVVSTDRTEGVIVVRYVSRETPEHTVVRIPESASYTKKQPISVW